MLFTVYKKDTGRICYSGWVNEDLIPNLLEDESILLGVKHDMNGWIDSSGNFQQIPIQPSINHIFNYTTKQWEDPRTLQDYKNQKWEEIKQARSTTEYAGFNWDGSTFDSDAESQTRINGAVTLALIAKQAAQPYTVIWTLKDNTLRALSADDMIAVGLALGNHVQTVFNKGQQLQQQIEQATTKEEIEAITWQI